MGTAPQVAVVRINRKMYVTYSQQVIVVNSNHRSHSTWSWEGFEGQAKVLDLPAI